MFSFYVFDWIIHTIVFNNYPRLESDFSELRINDVISRIKKTTTVCISISPISLEKNNRGLLIVSYKCKNSLNYVELYELE